MRSAIRKHLLTTFQREFEKLYPHFRLRKEASGSTKIWEWRIAPSLHYFVVLHPFEDYDTFVLEIAWSEDGEFPWASIGDKFDLGQRRWRGRLSRLWEPHGKEPVWDAAPEVAAATQASFDAMLRGDAPSYPPPPAVEVVIPRIAPLVDDCLQKFRQFGLSVFDKVTQNRGLPDSGESDGS